jgi:hypothetical protein
MLCLKSSLQLCLIYISKGNYKRRSDAGKTVKDLRNVTHTRTHARTHTHTYIFNKTPIGTSVGHMQTLSLKNSLKVLLCGRCEFVLVVINNQQQQQRMFQHLN